MSTFCQRCLYHRKCQRRGVGGQKKLKSCQLITLITQFVNGPFPYQCMLQPRLPQALIAEQVLTARKVSSARKPNHRGVSIWQHKGHLNDDQVLGVADLLFSSGRKIVAYLGKRHDNYQIFRRLRDSSNELDSK